MEVLYITHVPGKITTERLRLNVLRMERCCFFAHAPNGSVEKCWKAWAMSPVLAGFFQQELSNFFIFTTHREEVLVRARCLATLANTEHLPKQLSVYSSLQHTSLWPQLLKHSWFWYTVPLPIPLSLLYLYMLTQPLKKTNACPFKLIPFLQC